MKLATASWLICMRPVLPAAYSKNIRNKRNKRTISGRGQKNERAGQCAQEEVILSLGMGCTHARREKFHMP